MRIPDPNQRAASVAALAPFLDGEELSEAFAAVRGLRQPFARVVGTSDLLPYVGQAERTRIASELTGMANAVEDAWAKVQALLR